YSVPLFGGDNVLRATVSNADGTMWSDASATIAANFGAAAKKARAGGTLRALILGIQAYPHAPSHDLKYAVADAELFEATLKKYAAPLFAKVNVTLLS